MKTIAAILLLFASSAYGECGLLDRVYKDDLRGSGALVTQAVYVCGGKSHVERKWICRTNPQEEGVEIYEIERPRCPWQESEYDELKEQQGNK